MQPRDDLAMAFEAEATFTSFSTRTGKCKRDQRAAQLVLRGRRLDFYAINSAGAPLERLFFEARQQLDDAIRQLGHEEKERQFEKALGPPYDDYNFFGGYSGLQCEGSLPASV